MAFKVKEQPKEEIPPRPDTITIAGVELRGEDLTGKYCSRDERITAWSKRQPGGDTFWFASVFGDPVMGRDLEALDAAVRAAIAEIFRSLVPLVPAEVEAIRAEERERCAAVKQSERFDNKTGGTELAKGEVNETK